jgi:hypothetical protein
MKLAHLFVFPITVLAMSGCSHETAESVDEDEVVEEDEEVGEVSQELGNNCRNTDLFVGNLAEWFGEGTKIRVRKLEYWTDRYGYETEDVTNTEVPYSVAVTFHDEDLAKADGEVIEKWRITYDELHGDNWVGPLTQEDDTPDERCDDGDLFQMFVY